MEQMMSLKDIAALLNCKAYRIEYLLAHGLVAEPRLRVSGRRVFGPEDVANIRAHFENKKPAAKATAEPAAAGI
jgi:DNA-binding transcriptional MerR regulator